MPADPQRIQSIFLAALEAADPAGRAALLTRECGDDAELRQRVELLLQAHERSGSFLNKPAVQPVTTDEPAGQWIDRDAPLVLAERPGMRVGRYKLLQQIGEGGMGVVYMAEQEQPVRRRVALKIIKPGMDSAQVIARFEAERQALTMMDHQNIAKVLDAGTTESGRPYFVMELVYGVPITKFCDDSQLTPRERLELFVPICQAIQHAHQKGIIHRDIKPSNVLVTMHDDKPVPKVIDFGVAKAIEQRLTEKSLFTAFGTVVGTLEYMSPEQAEMNAFGVDTRGDVYSLGVLLYELLTGTTPLERKRLREAAYTEMLRLIKEEEPPRPSVRLSSSGDLPRIAAARRTEPARLSRLLRGEIDWIVMRCLEKDRTRRYESASALARDVERYLRDEAVEACPPSVAYRLRKFACKYKKALAITMAFATLLIAGVIVSTSLAVWATSAEQEANRQRDASDAAKQEAWEAKVEAEKQRDQARLTAYASGMQLAQHAWEENNVVRARELLEEVPKEAGGKDLRGFEWYYLSRLCHPETLDLAGHAHGMVHSVAFSPDGRHLASGSEDKTVKVWDTATGKELLAIKGHTDQILSVTFSPDGQHLASGGGDKTVKIWDSVTGKELLSLKGHDGLVSSVAFSPDGKRLTSGSVDGTVKIWDSATGKELSTRKIHADNHSSMELSPDGQRLASWGWGKTVKIWDCATGTELFALTGHDGWAEGVAFSPDGRLLASGGGDKTVKIWDYATGKELVTLMGHTERVSCVAFSPDGQRLASGSWDNTVKIWDCETCKELFALKGHTDLILSMAFSPDGQRLASGGWDKTVKIWDCATGMEQFSLKDAVENVHSVAFSPDGRRLASGSDHSTVEIWDSATGKVMLTLEGHTKRVVGVAFSPDGQRVASGSGDETVKLWDGINGKELFSLKGHDGLVYSVAFSPDGLRLASGSKDKNVKVWDSVTGKELFTLKGHARDVNSVAFSPDGRRVASGSDDSTVKIWDSVTGKELLPIQGHFGNVNSVAFSPDGKRLASGSADRAVKIWDSITGKELFTLMGHADQVFSVSFSPDGQRLASGSWDNTVKIWDTVAGKELITLKGHTRKVFSASRSPDGTLKGHAGSVNSMAFSPDGKRLASGGSGTVTIWETIVTPEVRDRRAANQVVADLFRQLGLRASVLERLRALPGMNPTRRQEALTAAQTYPENPGTFNNLAEELVKRSGRAMSDYRKALHYSEEACRIEPKNGYYLTTQGVAHYRLGNYEKALEVLQRSDKIHQAEAKSSIPADLAFLTMTQHRLGHSKEARAYLQQLRERMKDSRWAQDTEAQGFLREAETLLAKPTTPGNK